MVCLSSKQLPVCKLPVFDFVTIFGGFLWRLIESRSLGLVNIQQNFFGERELVISMWKSLAIYCWNSGLFDLKSRDCWRKLYKVNGRATTFIGCASVTAGTKETYRRTCRRIRRQCARWVQLIRMGRSNLWPSWYPLRRWILQGKSLIEQSRFSSLGKQALLSYFFDMSHSVSGTHVVPFWVPLLTTNISLPYKNVAS